MLESELFFFSPPKTLLSDDIVVIENTHEAMLMFDGYTVCNLCLKNASPQAGNTSDMKHYLIDFAKMNEIEKL